MNRNGSRTCCMERRLAQQRPDGASLPWTITLNNRTRSSFWTLREAKLPPATTPDQLPRTPTAPDQQTPAEYRSAPGPRLLPFLQPSPETSPGCSCPPAQHTPTTHPHQAQALKLCCGSASSTATRRPSAANSTAKLAQIVVLPTPPLRPVMAITSIGYMRLYFRKRYFATFFR